jgi:hypothetical protein
MIVLVDTSVWIRFLSNRAPHASRLDDLLDREEVSGHDLVYGELLMGDAGGRQRLLSDYEQLHQAPVVPHGDVVAFVRARRLHGRGIGWIDAHLLASSLVGGLKLWSVGSLLTPCLAVVHGRLAAAFPSKSTAARTPCASLAAGPVP